MTDTVCTTGIRALDAYLPAGGWPQTGIIELEVEAEGALVLPLLLPHMAALSQDSRWLAWLSPPFAPYLPALERAGVQVPHLLVIRPRSHQNGLWVLERALALGNFVSVFAWPVAQETDLIKRLKRAAEQGRCQAFLFRTLPTPAGIGHVDLHLRVDVRSDGLVVQTREPRQPPLRLDAADLYGPPVKPAVSPLQWSDRSAG